MLMDTNSNTYRKNHKLHVKISTEGRHSNKEFRGIFLGEVNGQASFANSLRKLKAIQSPTNTPTRTRTRTVTVTEPFLAQIARPNISPRIDLACVRACVRAWRGECEVRNDFPVRTQR